MILPIGDFPRPRGVPYATYFLIAVNVALYLLISLPLSVVAPDLRDPALAEYLRTIAPAAHVPVRALLPHISAYDLFVFAHGFRPAAPALSDLFVSLFLHAGLIHLAGNMLFLWIYGNSVENRLGPGRYLLAYVGAGAAASICYAFTAVRSSMPMIGASGAISGVLGLYFIFFPRNRVRLLFLFPPFLMNVVLVPARFVLGMYLIADNLLPFLLDLPTGVAYGAHIGGFAAGLGAASLLERRRPRAATPGHVDAEPARSRGDIAAVIAEKIARNEYGRAAVDYFALPAASTYRILAPGDAMALAGWLRRNGHPRASLTVLRRHLGDYPNGPRRAEAHIAAGMILLEDFGEATPAYQHFLDALDLDPEPDLAARARRGIAAIESLEQLDPRLHRR